MHPASLKALPWWQGVTLLRTNEAKIDEQAANQLLRSYGWDPAATTSLQASKFAFDAEYILLDITSSNAVLV